MSNVLREKRKQQKQQVIRTREAWMALAAHRTAGAYLKAAGRFSLRVGD
jgi:hypothetical protein